MITRKEMIPEIWYRVVKGSKELPKGSLVTLKVEPDLEDPWKNWYTAKGDHELFEEWGGSFETNGTRMFKGVLLEINEGSVKDSIEDLKKQIKSLELILDNSL